MSFFHNPTSRAALVQFCLLGLGLGIAGACTVFISTQNGIALVVVPLIGLGVGIAGGMVRGIQLSRGEGVSLRKAVSGQHFRRGVAITGALASAVIRQTGAPFLFYFVPLMIALLAFLSMFREPREPKR